MGNTRDWVDIITLGFTWLASIVTIITLPPVFVSQFLKKLRIEIGPFSFSHTNDYKIGFTIKNPSVFHHRKIRQIYLLLDDLILITLNSPSMPISGDFQEYMNQVIDVPPQEIALGSFSYNTCKLFDSAFDIRKLISASKKASIYYEDSFFKFHKIKYSEQYQTKKRSSFSAKRFLKMKDQGAFNSPSQSRSGFLEDGIVLSDSVKYLITIINRVTKKEDLYYVLHDGSVTPFFYRMTSFPKKLVESREILFMHIKKQLDPNDYFLQIDQNNKSRSVRPSFPKTQDEIIAIAKYQRLFKQRKIKHLSNTPPKPHSAKIKGVDYSVYFCPHDKCRRYLGDLLSDNEFKKRLGYKKNIIQCPRCGGKLDVDEIKHKLNL